MTSTQTPGNANSLKDTESRNKIKVYYDAACPRCVQEMNLYCRLERKVQVEWFDITGKEAVLRAEGIDPDAALK